MFACGSGANHKDDTETPHCVANDQSILATQQSVKPQSCAPTVPTSFSTSRPSCVSLYIRTPSRCVTRLSETLTAAYLNTLATTQWSLIPSTSSITPRSWRWHRVLDRLASVKPDYSRPFTQATCLHQVLTKKYTFTFSSLLKNVQFWKLTRDKFLNGFWIISFSQWRALDVSNGPIYANDNVFCLHYFISVCLNICQFF